MDSSFCSSLIIIEFGDRMIRARGHDPEYSTLEVELTADTQ